MEAGDVVWGVRWRWRLRGCSLRLSDGVEVEGV